PGQALRQHAGMGCRLIAGVVPAVEEGEVSECEIDEGESAGAEQHGSLVERQAVERFRSLTPKARDADGGGSQGSPDPARAKHQLVDAPCETAHEGQAAGEQHEPDGPERERRVFEEQPEAYDVSRNHAEAYRNDRHDDAREIITYGKNLRLAH